MLRWLASMSVVLAAGCYHPPEPDCGFFCGPGGACPEDYACVTSENRCHRAGAPADLVCPAGDAAIDAPHADAPRADAPRADAPPLDAPPADAPAADAPAADALPLG